MDLVIIGHLIADLQCYHTILMLPPNLDNLSPFEMAIRRKATLAPKFEYKPRIPITGTHTEAKEKLQEKIGLF